MGQESLDLNRPHLARMLATMVFDIPPHPSEVGLFRTKRQMSRANSFPRNLKQAPAIRHIIAPRSYATPPPSDSKEIRKMSEQPAPYFPHLTHFSGHFGRRINRYLP
jgi:hypothetical protein